MHTVTNLASILSAVMTFLFMEVLESEHYQQLLTRTTKWSLYVHNVQVITDHKTDIVKLTVHTKIST